MSNNRILLINRTADIIDLQKMVLRPEFQNIDSANSKDIALEKLRQQSPDIVIVDPWMQKDDPYGFLGSVKEYAPETPKICITTWPIFENVMEEEMQKLKDAGIAEVLNSMKIASELLPKVKQYLGAPQPIGSPQHL